MLLLTQNKAQMNMQLIWITNVSPNNNPPMWFSLQGGWTSTPLCMKIMIGKLSIHIGGNRMATIPTTIPCRLILIIDFNGVHYTSHRWWCVPINLEKPKNLLSVHPQSLFRLWVWVSFGVLRLDVIGAFKIGCRFGAFKVGCCWGAFKVGCRLGF